MVAVLVPESPAAMAALAVRMLVLGFAALALSPAAGRAQPIATIRIATNPIDSGAEVFYAKDLGLFAKAGLEVEIQPGQSGSAMAAAVASNAVDIAYADLGALSKAYTKGIFFSVLAPAALWTDAAPVNQFLVARDSPIRSAKDLSGKIVAVPGLGTGAEFATRTWIDKNGGDASTAKFVELAYSAMPAALAAGRVDAAYVAEPFLAVAKKDCRVLAYSDDAVGKEYLRTAWFSSAQWAKDHPDLAARFIAVMHETAVWANQKQNQAKSAAILVKYTKIDPALVSSMIRARYGEQLTPALLQPEIDITAKYSNFTPFPAQNLIYAGGK
jgi:NitT/TauT family transport system substrate-binding protein